MKNPTAETIRNRTISSPDKIMELIHSSRNGISFANFSAMVKAGPFTTDEWSQLLHVSLRSLQRYKKERKSFDPLLSERILSVAQLNEKGVSVFGDLQSYASWLETKSIALGGGSPKELLDTAFGIALVKDELDRLEHGIFA
ncbi:MAG: antitoxin Xre/MbcA/ParS toxin-binding domain-containing protein [Chitinophagales bacterium]